MFTCGFVPWRLRRIDSGDIVPEVLPLGTFTWSVEVNKRNSGWYKDSASANCTKRSRISAQSQAATAACVQPVIKKKDCTSAFHRQQKALATQAQSMEPDASKTLSYKIQFVEALAFVESQVEIYEYLQPTNNITYKSMMYATGPSPMAHVIVDYRILRQVKEGDTCHMKGCKH